MPPQLNSKFTKQNENCDERYQCGDNHELMIMSWCKPWVARSSGSTGAFVRWEWEVHQGKRTSSSIGHWPNHSARCGTAKRASSSSTRTVAGQACAFGSRQSRSGKTNELFTKAQLCREQFRSPGCMPPPARSLVTPQPAASILATLQQKQRL